ncbi:MULTISPECIES: IS200/IS605 family transposase [Gracilimonas]|uniref:IS200/IS605 family transposase n=1 Tax=Gracilimonas sediminicola TaxID=2952158 RepID=A0A9X2L5Q5_9BACT|nr:IS200/IS605 family transposase [Gracilimonas sediminicola]MCP9292866.1 IS200/IS605 family transposase [Gracilimonas sediminicola]
MSTYTQLLYQIVFSTKNRQPVLTKNNRKELYKYIWGILKNKQCHLYQINGVENHLHIITHIHPTVAISTLVKDIKLASSKFIKQNQLFTDFQGWQSGYGAFTYSIKAKDQLIEYVKNQEEHHKHRTFLEEYKALLSDHDISFDDRYLP